MKNLLGSVITARKRSLGQGNVFTRMCHSVHRGRRSALGGSTFRAPASRGVCLQGVWIQGSWADPLRYMRYYGIRSTSGRYASYWNAFLFLIKIPSVPMFGPFYPKMFTLLLLLSIYIKVNTYIWETPTFL